MYLYTLKLILIFMTHSFLDICVALKRAVVCPKGSGCDVYLEVVYFVTALVPSLTACFASSPGRIRRTAV